MFAKRHWVLHLWKHLDLRLRWDLRAILVRLFSRALTDASAAVERVGQ
jgi:hypothetical protein